MVDRLRIVTLNVGVYMMGGMYITEMDFGRLDSYIQSQAKFYQNIYHLPSMWFEDTGVTYLQPQISIEISQLLCMRILSELAVYSPHLLCIQEDLIIQDEHGTFNPLFDTIYRKFGYTPASICESHVSNSPLLIHLYGQGKCKLANIIYIKDDNISSNVDGPRSGVIENLDGVGEKGCSISSQPRCAAYVIYDQLKIFNTHLCGGRYDDLQALSQNLQEVKIDEMQSILEYYPDIICGDFNAGYSSNYEYPRSLIGRKLTELDRIKWNTWQYGVLDHIQKSAMASVMAKYDETSFRGKIMIDWIFYRPDRLRMHWDAKIPMYLHRDGIVSEVLTDHHALFVEFEPISTSTPYSTVPFL